MIEQPHEINININESTLLSVEIKIAQNTIHSLLYITANILFTILLPQPNSTTANEH